MKQTSRSHPLLFASVHPTGVPGEIGMTICPGKIQQSALSGTWERDLQIDMAAILDWGTNVLVTLMEPRELVTYQVAGIREAVPEGIQHYVLPIRDGSVPDAPWEEAWRTVGPVVRECLRGGRRVVIHCRGGLGRTGLVTARLLVEFGEDAESAIARVRAVRPGAIENRQQEDYVRAQKSLIGRLEGDPDARAAMSVDGLSERDRGIRDRFVGCLLGGAVGDALGAPVEFMRRAEILKRFGPHGITAYAAVFGRIGAITDDTQMTLFTAEGLLRNWVRADGAPESTVARVTANALLRWLRTQGVSNDHNTEADAGEPGWLFEQRELHSRRAPGNTCVSSLRAMKQLGQPARNDSKGCGAVMRAAPIGLYGWRLKREPREIFRLGTALGALTHGHPTGSLTSGALAVLISFILDDVPLPDALSRTKCLLREAPAHEETLRAIERAEELAASRTEPSLAIAHIGEGWIAEEALAVSIYCALVATDFRQGVILAVNHDGDSDSTGSITGNLLGATHGIEAIPAGWLEPLELRLVISTVAEDLFEFPNWLTKATPEHAATGKKKCERYPG